MGDDTASGTADEAAVNRGDAPSSGGAASPARFLADVVRSGWNTLRTVYWANSPSWRFLKAGGLLFFGFFLWASSNILLSYRPGWWPLRYAMAYGFVVAVYGPVHHLLVVPLALRWRRADGIRQRVGRRLPDGALAVFLAVVAVLGTFPTGPMTVDFGSALADSGADVNPDLQCVKSASGGETRVHCHLGESQGVARVVVESGGEEIAVDDRPPFEFTVNESEMATVNDQQRFTVHLLDEDGELVRRYSRTLGMIREG